jgi:hypothetical protein
VLLVSQQISKGSRHVRPCERIRTCAVRASDYSTTTFVAVVRACTAVTHARARARQLMAGHHDAVHSCMVARTHSISALGRPAGRRAVLHVRLGFGFGFGSARFPLALRRAISSDSGRSPAAATRWLPIDRMAASIGAFCQHACQRRGFCL